MARKRRLPWITHHNHLSRPLRFESLEQRWLLDAGGLIPATLELPLDLEVSSLVIADDPPAVTAPAASAADEIAAPLVTTTYSFAQAAWLDGDEVAVLTVDTDGASQVFYSPNFDLGYLDPETGDLLLCDYYPGTTSVFALNCAVTGNVSNLAGLHYSNGQLIATDGGNTIFHRDGSLMRSGGSWFYDAGSVLKAGASYNWSNGAALKTGSTFFHPNGATFRNSANSIFYASATTFYDSATESLAYPSGQALRNASSDYFYETGVPLETNDVISYSSGTVMVDAAGTPHNTNGSVAILPFSRYAALANSESFTNVTADFAETTTSIAHDFGGGFGAYVTYQKIVYQTRPPVPTNITVATVDAQTLLFTWASGGGSTVDYLVATTLGTSPPADFTAGTATADNFLLVGGLTAGDKVSFRLCARDAEGTLSDPVTGTGTAGALTQSPQTGYLIESGLANTFAQVIDNGNKGIIFTVDRDNNSQVFFRPNADLGYLNPENGDRLECSTYEVPWTETRVANIDDCRVIGNISAIASGTQYPNGQLVRSGDTFYYDTGAVLRSAELTWFHPNGNPFKSGSSYYWSGGTTMRTPIFNNYPTGVSLKAGPSILYTNGVTFSNTTSAFYPSGSNLKTSDGDLFYQNGAQLFASNVFRYLTNATMISSDGTPYNFDGTQSIIPFIANQNMATAALYLRLGADLITRYGIAIQGNLAVFMYGGSQDYAPSADFDEDGDIDGRDFLKWQRGESPTPFSAVDLALWQEEYGGGLLSVVSSPLSVEEEFAILESSAPSYLRDEVTGQIPRSSGLSRDDNFSLDPVFEDRYVENVDQALEELGASTLLGKPAVAPFGEMVVRRGTAQRITLELFEPVF